MPIKDLLVILEPEQSNTGAFALSVASAFEARLTAAVPLVRPSVPSYAAAEIPAELFARASTEARAAGRAILDGFALDARASGVETEGLIVEGTLADASRKCAGLARHFDLTIVRQGHPQDEADRQYVIESILFGSGRPLIVFPHVPTRVRTFDTVIVAWDGGAQAARALGDAIPILQRARSVEVVRVEGGGENINLPGFNISRHLSRHGIHADLQIVPRVGSVADSIMSRASVAGADLLVMGGYGHSRLREVILGGATRSILASATLPVLMAR